MPSHGLWMVNRLSFDVQGVWVVVLLSVVTSKGGLIGVCDVEEAIGVFSLVVDLAHQGISLEDVSAIDKEV